MKLLAVIALFGAVLICCEAKKKCGFAVKSCDAGVSSPCPKNAICPKGAKINRKNSGCCCATTKPTGPCGANEALSNISNTCTQCALLFMNASCKPARLSKPACNCVAGYLYDHNNKCVKSENCKPQCGTNSVYSACGGRCQATCEKPSVVCPTGCFKGCVCKAGFVKKGSQCVALKECGATATTKPPPGSCGPNQEMSLMSDGCTSCAMLFSMAQCRPARYTTPQCACKSGFRRDHNQNCIKSEDCKPQCGINKVYSPCGARCQASCADPKPKCPSGCSKGCVCAPGFVYNSNSVCVPKAECDLCKGDEVYSACGAGCQASCDKRNPICTRICKKGCICKSGYVRRQGKCVHNTDCPRTCGANSAWTETAGECDVCYWYGLNIKTKAECPSKRIRPNCECNPGFYKNQMGECVTGAACACSVLESYSECGCEKTCANASAKLACSKATCKKGCFCNDTLGFVRHNGACISSQSCPKP